MMVIMKIKKLLKENQDTRHLPRLCIDFNADNLFNYSLPTTDMESDIADYFETKISGFQNICESISIHGKNIKFLSSSQRLQVFLCDFFDRLQHGQLDEVLLD